MNARTWVVAINGQAIAPDYPLDVTSAMTQFEMYARQHPEADVEIYQVANLPAEED